MTSDVRTVVAEGARASGPVTALQYLLGTVESSTEVLALKSVTIVSPDNPQYLVTLSVPEQIAPQQASQIVPGMPVYLVGEKQAPYRSELGQDFNNLCAVVQDKALFITRLGVPSGTARAHSYSAAP